MQSVSSRIWTCVTVSIPYDNNHYTTGTCRDAVGVFCIPTLDSKFWKNNYSAFYWFILIMTLNCFRWWDFTSGTLSWIWSIFSLPLLQGLPTELAGAVEYIDCISAEGVRLPQMSVLDMTLNYLMVRHQPWRFGECGVPLHCHCSQVLSDLEW